MLNLTGNAKELWVAGIRDIKSQIDDLNELFDKSGVKDDQKLSAEILKSIASTKKLVLWLEAGSSKKTGPSGVGKENYNWYAKNVHLVPLTWDDQVILLKRELSRAWASLKLEEHRNRKLPLLSEANTALEYDSLNERSVKSIIQFLDQQQRFQRCHLEPELSPRPLYLQESN